MFCLLINPWVRAIELVYVNDSTFVADTGPPSHMVKSIKYFTEFTPITTEKTLGNEDLFQCTEKRIYRGFFKNIHVKDVPIVLQDVMHVPWLAVNLLSIAKCITKQGVQFSANIKNFVLEYKWCSD
jgi:hypothetical protein